MNSKTSASGSSGVDGAPGSSGLHAAPGSSGVHAAPGSVRNCSGSAALKAELSELLSLVDPASVVNVMLQRGFSRRATDIHLDPMESGVRVRFRIDGALQDIVSIPASRAAQIMSRVKVVAGMDISDRRLPQDGHISAAQHTGLPRDVRVGSSPTVLGERLVLRLMPDSAEFVSPETLGLSLVQLNSVNELCGSPHGLLLVVGPVGAGKTTTVYSLLSRSNQPDKSLVTIEDPVERRIQGANQIQVDLKTGLLFSTALRGVLRQDPDIISIGEIRDAETAQIACRAATTGVLVLSTLHANNTASAVDVLRHLGISSTTIADCLLGIISQRLVRTIDHDAYDEYHASPEACRVLGVPSQNPPILRRGIPTEQNFHTGFSGRTAVFEVMKISTAVRNAISIGTPAFKIEQLSISEGMATLEESTRKLVLERRATVSELNRVMQDLRFGENHTEESIPFIE